MAVWGLCPAASEALDGELSEESGVGDGEAGPFSIPCSPFQCYFGPFEPLCGISSAVAVTKRLTLSSNGDQTAQAELKR
jgi:hypothetical protein